MSEEEGSWTVSKSRRKMSSIRTRTIPIKWEYIGLIIGTNGANIKRLAGLTADVISANVNNNSCMVFVKAYSDAALDCVENEIRLLMDKMILPPRFHVKKSTVYQIQNDSCVETFAFKTIWPNILDDTRFCSMFGIDPKYIKDGELVSIKDVEANKLAHIQNFERLWNTNASFLDSEEIWRRGRHSIRSNFIHRLLVTSNFVRSSNTYIELNGLRRLSGINYIDVVCKEEDIILMLEIGSETQNQLDACVAKVQSNFKEYLETLKVHRFCSNENDNPEYLFCIPYTSYTCSTEKLCEKSKFSGIPYLETLYSSDSEVTLVELNEIEQTMTLACSSQARLDRLLFEVRGHLSFFKAFAWRKNYHGDFRCHIKASNDQIKMDVIFEDVSELTGPLLSADFTDVVTDNDSLKLIKLLEPFKTYNIRSLRYDPYATSNYTLYRESSMISKFQEFLKFDDLPFLHDINAYTRFGMTLFKVMDRLLQGSIHVSTLLDFWQKGFYGSFSFDLNSSFKEVFDKCLSAVGCPLCTEIGRQCFTEVFFSDVGNNFRFMARITSEGPLLDKPVEVNYCRMDHIHFRVIDIDSSKCSKQIIVSSQKPCENVRAKNFVEDSIRSGELLAENVMSLNSHYSMYNVSIVNRTVLQYKDFIIHLDSVSKKSNQRYGRFSDVVHLTLHYPRLNDAIHQLQRNTGDDSLIKSTVELYEELISASEYFSVVIDKYIEQCT